MLLSYLLMRKFFDVIASALISYRTAGLHFSPEEIDFGILTAPADRHSVLLRVWNSAFATLCIQDISLSSPDAHLQIIYKKNVMIYMAHVFVFLRFS